jgi:hypothetical protein
LQIREKAAGGATGLPRPRPAETPLECANLPTALVGAGLAR